MQTRAPLLVLVLLVAGALSAACVDGTTPDCSKVNCGPPTSDGAVILDAQADTRPDDGDDGGTGDGGTSDATVDSGVDAKTD